MDWMTTPDLADMRARHTEHPDAARWRCAADGQDWPCDVTRLLDALTEARGDAAALAAATWKAAELAAQRLDEISTALAEVKFTAGPLMAFPDTRKLHNGGACKICHSVHSGAEAAMLNTGRSSRAH